MIDQTAMRDLLTDAELDAVVGGESRDPYKGSGNYRVAYLDNNPAPQPNVLGILGSVLGSLVGIK